MYHSLGVIFITYSYVYDYNHFHVSSFFFNATATTEIYTLSLHNALPISPSSAAPHHQSRRLARCHSAPEPPGRHPDRKSTRLNSSHLVISYAVFCLKKKKTDAPGPHRILALPVVVDGVRA